MYLDFKVKIPSDSPGITRKKIKGATYIVDISQLQYTLEKAGGYEFVIMMKGMKQLVKSLVLEVKGTFEENRRYSIRDYKISGITIKRQLYPSDETV